MFYTLYIQFSSATLTSKINDLLSSLKCEEMLQNLLIYLYEEQIHVFFFRDQDIHKIKMKAAQNEKWKKHRFSFYINNRKL